MDIGEVLIGEVTNGLLLFPGVIGLAVLVRWIRGQPVFTERDRLVLFGPSPKEVLWPRLLLTFTGLLLLVMSLASESRFTSYPTVWGGLQER